MGEDHWLSHRMVAHVGVFSFLICVFYPLLDRTLWNFFLLHPSLMMLGFVGLSEGILFSSSIVSKQRRFYVNLHLFLQLISLLFSVISLWVIFTNKSLKSSLHFASWHGFIGVFLIIFLLFQSFFGVLLYFIVPLTSCLGFGNKERLRMKKMMREFHLFFGIGLYLTYAFVICLGFQSTWAGWVYNGGLVPVLTIFSCGVALFVISDVFSKESKVASSQEKSSKV